MTTLWLFLPEAALTAVAILILCLALLKDAVRERTLSTFAASAAAVVVLCVAATLRASGPLFSGTYQIDGISQGFKLMISIGYLFAVLYSAKPFAIPAGRLVEHHFFLATATLGMLMIPSSVDALPLYVSIELSAYSLYALAAMRGDRRSTEASVKYYIFGASASAIFIWGLSLLCGLAGTTSMEGLARHAFESGTEPAFLFGMILVTLAFLFKLSAFPMHFWAPDVYEASSTPVTSFIATASKAAAVALLVRLLFWTGVSEGLAAVLGVLAFLSMTLGNCVAIAQTDVKRLLAYSSVAQAGYLVVGILSGTADGYASAMFYALAYVLMNAGAFLVTLAVARAANNDNPSVGHFDGLAERSPFLALLLLLSLLSLAGIPPLVGFTGKWVLFAAAMEKGHWFLVLWAVLNSVVSLFYYLTLVKHAYLEKPSSSSPIKLSPVLQIAAWALVVALIVLGVFPAPVIDFCRGALAAAAL